MRTPRALESACVCLLEEQTEFVNVLGDLSVVQPAARGGCDFQFADHREVAQRMHAGAVTAPVDVVRKVDPRFATDDCIELDLASRNEDLPSRPSMEMLEDGLASNSINAELAYEVTGEPDLVRRFRRPDALDGLREDVPRCQELPLNVLDHAVIVTSSAPSCASAFVPTWAVPCPPRQVALPPHRSEPARCGRTTASPPTPSTRLASLMSIALGCFWRADSEREN